MLIRRCTLFAAVCSMLFIVSTSGALPPPSSVYSNGTFVSLSADTSGALTRRASENGSFTCSFEVANAGERARQLRNFRCFENSALRSTIAEPPGSDVLISNAGFILFCEPVGNAESEMNLYCYAAGSGRELFKKHFMNSQLFGFSPMGTSFGIGSSTDLAVIDLNTGNTITCLFKIGCQFAISEDEAYVVVACENELVLFSRANGVRTGSVSTGMVYTRRISISPDGKSAAIVDKRNLRVYSLPGLTPLFSDILNGKYSFNDAQINGNTLYAGIQYRDETAAKGFLKTYDLADRSSRLELKASAPTDRQKCPPPGLKKTTTASPYPQIPWPFSPQNQPHTIWNDYECLNTATNGDTAGAYLHQGVDVYCPAYTQAYAVADGIVKCRLTFASNPSIYWRIATSETQNSGWSTGWLYAHLVQSTIQFNVGDTVHTGDYIAQIVPWDSVGGHIHFARIRDTGTVWTYAAPGNEWGIVYNPELSLTPMGDTKAPIIIQARTGISKFAYCTNETFTYQTPGNLTGNIDIIVKCFDTIGTSNFRHPAFAIYYWIKRRDNGQMVKDTTRGEWRNHYYPMYEATEYHPWALMQYKVDVATFPPGDWFNRARTFAHIITNRSGDSIITAGDKDSSLHTNTYTRTWHRLFVKVCDASGNCTVDSEDVYFAAGVGVADEKTPVQELQPMQIVSGRSFSGLKITFALPSGAGDISLRLYDLAGNEVVTLARGDGRAGPHMVFWNGSDHNGRPLGYGTYLCVLTTKGLTAVRRITYCR